MRLESRTSKGAVALFSLILALTACGKSVAEKDAEAGSGAYREKYARAQALFEERCKTAGVVIKRTVKDVEGIELTKIRQPIPWGGKEYFDPMWAEAAMADEVTGDDYLKQFLVSEFIQPGLHRSRGDLGPPTTEKRSHPSISIIRKGYAYIEYLDAKDKQRYRCTPDWSKDHPNWVPGQHQCEPVKQSRTRYALDYEDIVSPADRQFWVAGTRLKIIDKQSGEEVAVLTRFVWDSGFGVSTSGRWPWVYASSSSSSSCPSDASRPTSKHGRYFVDTVLIPKQGD